MLVGFWMLSFSIFSNLDISACIFKANDPLDTCSISFGSTQNKQQYDTKITATDFKKSYVDLKYDNNFFGFFNS